MNSTDQENQGTKRFVVLRTSHPSKGGKSNYVKHKSLHSAVAEAKRLEEKTGDSFYVAKIKYETSPIMGDASTRKDEDVAKLLQARGGERQQSLSSSSVIELIEAAKDACRFLDYFVHGKTFFEGGGMPITSLERLQAAISVAQDEIDCEPATPEMAKHVDIVNDALKRIGSLSSEISVVEAQTAEARLAFNECFDRLNNGIYRPDAEYWFENGWYAKAPKPVVVSLEKCEKQVENILDLAFAEPATEFTSTEIVKAVLDAAGVKYVD